MVSIQDSQKFRFDNKMELWDHDPASTAATVVTPDGGTTQRWFKMSDFGGFTVAAMASTLTGAGITKLEIVAADDALGTNLTVIKDSGTVAVAAVGDWVIEECQAEEVAQESATAGVNLKYVAGRITMANAADEAVVTYVGFEARFEQDNLTPKTTIA